MGKTLVPFAPVLHPHTEGDHAWLTVVGVKRSFSTEDNPEKPVPVADIPKRPKPQLGVLQEF